MALIFRRLGPLESISTFVYKNINGILAKIIHGSKHQGKDLVNSLIIVEVFKVLKQKVKNKSYLISVDHLLGKSILCDLSDNDRLVIRTSNVQNDFFIYGRMRINGNDYSSKLYEDKHPKLESCNSYIAYQNNVNNVGFGRIKCFLKANNKIYILVQKLKVNHENIIYNKSTHQQITHLIPITDESYLDKSNIIKSKLFRVPNYICKRTNKFKENL